MDIKKFSEGRFGKGTLTELKNVADTLRADADMPTDVSLMDVANEHFNLEGDKKIESFEQVLEECGVNPKQDTIQNLLTQQAVDAKWLVPEYIRSVVNTGISQSPIYPNITAAEQTISAQKAQVPYMNQSDAAPRYVGEGETIQLGSISYGSKEFKVRKMGRGIKLTDELRKYSKLNIVSIFLRDFGIRLGYGLDSLAIATLLNGEQADGSASAPVIGVTTPNTLTYKDLLRVWVRLSRMGKNPSVMVGGEDMAMNILDLAEFKKSPNSAPAQAKLNLRTAIPASSDFFIHASVPANQVIILDPRTTMGKFNAMPLTVESERIVSNQTEATYITLASGFAILFRDSRVVIDQTQDVATNGFPDYMNVDALVAETIK